MNQNGFIRVVLLVGVLLIAIIVVGFYLGKSKTPEQNSLSSSPTSSTAYDVTANWKTYTNNKFNYSIKYPESFVYKEYDNGDVRFFVAGEEEEKENDLIRFGKHLSILYREGTPEQSVRSEALRRPTKSVIINNAIGIQMVDMRLDYYLSSNLTTGPTLRILIFVPDGSVKTTEEALEYETTLKKMLNTFKFTNYFSSQEECQANTYSRCNCMLTRIDNNECTGWAPVSY